MSRRNDGFVTAEAAVVLPTLMVVMGLLLGVVVTVGNQLRCVDAARSGARMAARGESEARVRSAAAQVAPRGAVVEVVTVGGEVKVTVRLVVRPTDWLPALHLSAHAVMPVEQP